MADEQIPSVDLLITLCELKLMLKLPLHASGLPKLKHKLHQVFKEQKMHIKVSKIAAPATQGTKILSSRYARGPQASC